MVDSAICILLFLTNPQCHQRSKCIKVRLFVNGKHRKTLARYRPDDINGNQLDLNRKKCGGAKNESIANTPTQSASSKKRPRNLCLTQEQQASMLSRCTRSMKDYGLSKSEWSSDHKYVGQQVLRYGYNLVTLQRWFTPAVIVAYYKPKRGRGCETRKTPSPCRHAHREFQYVNILLYLFFCLFVFFFSYPGKASGRNFGTRSSTGDGKDADNNLAKEQGLCELWHAR